MVFVALIHFALGTTTHAADDPLKFSDPIQQQRYAIQRAGQCTSWRLELWEYQTSTFEDRQVRFSVSLRNIGTFLDFGTGSDLSGDQRSYNY